MIIIFDFDSTIFPFESLEDLIALKLRKPEAQKRLRNKMNFISNLAMNGELDFKTSLEKRLKLTQLIKKDIENYVKKREKWIEPQISELIQKLKINHHIYIVSGGFIDYILPLCQKRFNLSKNQIYANQFIFNKQNQVIGFDETNHLVQSNGKIEVVEAIKKLHSTQRVVMIGDGYTDWLVYQKKAADRFIAVGYYQSRFKVKEKVKEMSQFNQLNGKTNHHFFVSSISELEQYLTLVIN